MDVPRSSIAGIAWPAIPSPAGATMLALQYQLEQSQWWPPEALRERQFEQLRLLLKHAFETVPFYRERLWALGFEPDSPVDPDLWSRIPLITRREIQEAGSALLSSNLPRDHGRPLQYQSSGSTGEPIKVVGNELTHFFWAALTLRDHLWHRRDLSGKLAAIRTKVEGEPVVQGWGPATDAAFTTGPCAALDIATDLDAQLDWLARHDPDCLLTHPSNALALARRSLERGVVIPKLKEVRTFGETLSAGLREACRKAWSAKVTDMYSCEEAGYIALQCPEHQHYHVQAENLLVEILDERGQPCAPGEVGRVVLTPLHNFAMPLIRYVNGDYAEAGGPCPCGRGLPVLKRILGRSRNLVRLPDGTRHWPSFPSESWSGIAPIRQIQLVQTELNRVEARVVAERPLSPGEERRFVEAFQASLGYPFEITLSYFERIERSASFKYEDFVCLLPE